MNDLRKKLLGGFCAALIGFLWGWLLGWSLFNPNLDLWALFAAICALVGLVIGLIGLFWKRSTEYLCATFGLYLGFIIRTLLFGDTSRGLGLVVIAIAVIAGIWIARRYQLQEKPGVTIVLLNVLLIGFFGGYLMDILLLNIILGSNRPHTVLARAPLVIFCGLLGGLVSARRVKQVERTKNP